MIYMDYPEKARINPAWGDHLIMLGVHMFILFSPLFFTADTSSPEKLTYYNLLDKEMPAEIW